MKYQGKCFFEKGCELGEKMFMGDNGIHVNVAPYKKTKEAKPEAKAEPKKPKAKKPKKTAK